MPAGTQMAGRLAMLASIANGTDMPAWVGWPHDLGRHRALGGERRDGRHRREEDVDLVEQLGHLLLDAVAGVVHRGDLRERGPGR